jgi:hypothetical protein
MEELEIVENCEMERDWEGLCWDGLVMDVEGQEIQESRLRETAIEDGRGIVRPSITVDNRLRVPYRFIHPTESRKRSSEHLDSMDPGLVRSMSSSVVMLLLPNHMTQPCPKQP